ncbi:glycosyltransferase family 4 protein [Eudoraea adriatica]|uniref:glycosyltransferase family 4 protein n=1 Tax=Eudoraea adriatica TaxID=446681 RepID=UPI00039E0097|nr:glycosyltransferase [Eudoraea adriatica]
MKILFIHNNYASNTSGEEFAAEAMERLLITNGYEVAWYRRFSDVINNSFSKKVSAFFLGIYNPRAISEIKDLLSSFEPDVVQIQNLYPFISPAIIKTIRKKGIPIVMRCPNYRLFCPTGLHMDGKGKVCEKCLSVGRELNCIVKNCEKDYAKSIGYALRNFLARTLWGLTRNMDAYMVQTAFQREKFINNGIPPKKLFIVPGITPSIPTGNESFESKYVSFVGRISEEKGIKEFLEAASLLPTLPFVVAGGVKKSQSDLKASSPANVIWKGFLSGKDLDLIFKQSKIVVVPSKWYEGFPNVITKAMKHGKPVITSNLGAMAAIIDHRENGVLVGPGDTIGLAKAIQELYRDTEKCNLYGGNAKKKADTLFSPTKVYDDLMGLYNGLLKEKEKSTRKILFILHYPPPVHGAAMVGQYIMESNSLNSNFDCQYINLGTSVSIDEIGKGSLIKGIRYFKLLGLTIKKLYRFKPNLVYLTLTASGAGFYKDSIIVMMAKAFGKKVVVHFHNKGVGKRQDKWFDNLLYKMVFKKTEVILLSEHLYPDIGKYFPKKRVHYCANGIPENKVLKLITKSNKSKVEILFLSNLITSKGVYILLEACQILQAKKLPFHCTFIGGGGDVTVEQFQEKVNALGLSNNVHYAGRKYGVEKEEAYSQADIFTLPTFNECFPLVLLEAMQFSLPIVSTYEGGIREIVKDGKTGFLVQQQDANALAEKLEILILNPELRLRMGEAGRKHYEKHFTLELFETRFSNIIKELV